MWRILSKEARELAASPISFGLLMLLPCIVLWLAVRLPEAQRPMQIYIEGSQCGVETPGAGVEVAPCETPSASQVRQALSDAPDVDIVELERGDQDLTTFVSNNRLDAAVIWSPVVMGASESTWGFRRGGVWTVYADPRSRSDAARLDLVVRMLEANELVNAAWRQARAESAANAETASAQQGPDVRLPAVGPLMSGLAVASTMGVAPFTEATPFVVVSRNGAASATSTWRTPGLIALMAGFIAFLVGALRVARESEQGTLHWLGTATRGAWLSVGLAKSIVATAVAVFALFVMLMFAWLGLGQANNPGLPMIAGLQAISLFAAGIQGVAVSALVGRQDQAFLISGAYLVLLTLFSGVFLPVAGAGGATEIISWFLPTTFSQEPLTDWMQRGAANPPPTSSLLALAALLIASMAAMAISLRVLATRQ